MIRRRCRNTSARLARDHRKYGVKEKHYAAFTKALATAMRLVSGPVWTAEMAPPGNRPSAMSAR